MKLAQTKNTPSPILNGPQLPLVAHPHVVQAHRVELFACIRDEGQIKPFEGTTLAQGRATIHEAVYRRKVTVTNVPIAEELTKHLKSLNHVNPIVNQTRVLIVGGRRFSLDLFARTRLRDSIHRGWSISSQTVPPSSNDGQGDSRVGIINRQACSGR